MFKIKFLSCKIVILKVRDASLINPPYKPFDPVVRVAPSKHTFERDADKSLQLKPSKSSKQRPSPAYSPRNAFWNFMLIWLVTFDQRQARERDCKRTRGLDLMERDTRRRQWRRRRFGLSTPLTAHCPPQCLLSSTLSAIRLTGKRQNG